MEAWLVRRILRMKQGGDFRGSGRFEAERLSGSKDGWWAGLIALAFSVACPLGAWGDDLRLGEHAHVNGYHPFRGEWEAGEWEGRAAEIRRRVQVAAGLWPMPERGPLKVELRGGLEMDGYVVDEVILESFPGHYVTGSLYRPTAGPAAGGDGYPVVLSPHGHWNRGRFYDAGEAQVRRDLASGAERFESAARNPQQARAVQLARMGCIVFHYDMVGYADSVQLPEHRLGPRERLDRRERGEWGLGGLQAAAWLQTSFGVQTYNSVRALDFMLGLEGVDPGRVLITGASGGATQSMMLAAIDERVSASFPAVMVSTAMQGGCTCENSFYLRVGQGNIDIAAAVAPRPQGLTAADDWTKELETKGYPDLRALYDKLGVGERFRAHFDLHHGHNFNHVSRVHLYGFVNRHFGLGLEEPILETDFRYLGEEELSVWGEGHERPEGDAAGEAHERALCRWWMEDAERQVGEMLAPADAEGAALAREVLGGAVEVMIGRRYAEVGEVEFEMGDKVEGWGHVRMDGILKNLSHGEEVGICFLHPGDWGGKVAVVVLAGGRGELGEVGQGELGEAVAELLAAGVAVVVPDLFLLGAEVPEGWSAEENPRIGYPGNVEREEDQWRLSPVYYYGYNPGHFARRVHDLLSVIRHVDGHPDWDVDELVLVGTEGAGHWAAAARALAGGAVGRLLVATGGFRFAEIESVWDADFLPGAAKYGDMTGLLALSAPHALWVEDGDEVMERRLRASWDVYGAGEELSLVSDEAGASGLPWWVEGVIGADGPDR
jgi:hypothetical protein